MATDSTQDKEGNFRFSEAGQQRKSSASGNNEDKNRARRERYHDDIEYRETQKRRSLTSYRKYNVRQRRVKSKPEVCGEEREVSVKQEEDTQVLEVFTLPKAAEYLDVTYCTIKRWVAEFLIPSPCMFCVRRGYGVYSRGELQTIAKVLDPHFETYDYLHRAHDTTIEDIWQAIEGYRKSNY